MMKGKYKKNPLVSAVLKSDGHVVVGRDKVNRELIDTWQGCVFLDSVRPPCSLYRDSFLQHMPRGTDDLSSLSRPADENEVSNVLDALRPDAATTDIPIAAFLEHRDKLVPPWLFSSIVSNPKVDADLRDR